MISVDAWLVIDAVLDNTISDIIQSGESDEENVVDHAQQLRQRGWDANAAHPLRGHGPVGWPPRDATLDLTLSESDLAFIHAQIDKSIRLTRIILDSERLTEVVRVEQLKSLAGLEAAAKTMSQR
ncbi:hypothetical protein GCM10022286_23530 [Gryllotalpicola daejeonensis]|uniref:DUF222 domain-containing protein n=1 Tax=Gryllotalpicola daejeonensis TaxID=993087 RepID=A0ABP7ZLM8_9MICO